MANHNSGPGLQSGGMTVYYFQPGGNAPLTAFRKVCCIMHIVFICDVLTLFGSLGLPHVGRRCLSPS